MLPTAREPIAYPLTRRPAAKRQIARREEAARARRVDARRAPNSDRRARRRARRGVISLSRGAAERDRHLAWEGVGAGGEQRSAESGEGIAEEGDAGWVLCVYPGFHLDERDDADVRVLPSAGSM